MTITIEFTNCIWCEKPVDEYAGAVDELTTLGRVFGHVCRACDRLINKETNKSKEDN